MKFTLSVEHSFAGAPLPGELGEKVLETAPAGTVLAGTIRKRVLSVAQEQGYTVSETSPDPRQRHLWQEAFLCNALRMMQPLAGIDCPECGSCSFQHDSTNTPEHAMLTCCNTYSPVVLHQLHHLRDSTHLASLLTATCSRTHL